jgi:hypothetical protein
LRRDPKVVGSNPTGPAFRSLLELQFTDEFMNLGL